MTTELLLLAQGVCTIKYFFLFTTLRNTVIKESSKDTMKNVNWLAERRSEHVSSPGEAEGDWALMRLDAAYEISISISWKTMLSPSSTCTNTIKKYYEKLKDAAVERKK